MSKRRLKPALPLCFILIAVLYAASGFSQKSIIYSATPNQPLRIYFDYYHHSLPNTKVGNHLITGSWIAGAGRYAWDDFVHSNTFDPVFTSLGAEHYITIGREYLSKNVLANQDAVLILNPDNPSVVPGVPVVSNEEIDNLKKFVSDGGSLMVMINAATPERSNEDFESVQLKKLVNIFGLDWNLDDTHYSDIVIGNGHPYFFDVPVFHYGAGCTIKILPNAKQPEVLMNVYSDAGYPDRHVNGPGIVMTRYGKGKMILVGDIGSWTGNMSRPWSENDRILKQLFRYLLPDKGVKPAIYPKGQTLDYTVTVAGLQAIPVANSISEFQNPLYRYFKPREKTGMPYIEGTADVQLTSTEVTSGKASLMRAGIKNFKWFDELVNDSVATVDFTASRQGKVTDVVAKGKAGNWLASEISSLIGLLPVDGLTPGSSWESVEYLKIPVLVGTETGPVRPLELKITYMRDEILNGRKCRLLRSADEIWLKDLGITPKDLLPGELINLPGGSHYKFFNERGGKLMFKREQWVDASTGVVVKARNQSRILMWMQDLRKPVEKSNADKDNHMIMALSQIITMDLK
jgi:hypothetical protein